MGSCLRRLWGWGRDPCPFGLASQAELTEAWEKWEVEGGGWAYLRGLDWEGWELLWVEAL